MKVKQYPVVKSANQIPVPVSFPDLSYNFIGKLEVGKAHVTLQCIYCSMDYWLGSGSPSGALVCTPER